MLGNRNRGLGSPSVMWAVTIVLVVAPAVSPRAHAQAEQVLYSFGSAMGDGNSPLSGLVSSPAGAFLFGTTSAGGDLTCGNGAGCGTVYELKANGNGTWTETTLLPFNGGAKGQAPHAGVARSKQGGFFGTTLYGGGGTGGSGVLFDLFQSGGGWKELVVHDFNGIPDGAGPLADLWLDSNGNIYGTTQRGGLADFGSIFKVDRTTRRYSLLYSFTGGADGSSPESGLVQDASGNFYGTTNAGGSAGGFGTIFQLDPTGTTKTVIYNFTGPPDGAAPIGSLAIDSSGNLYGATENGGDPTCDCGIVFLLSPPVVQGGPWNESVKYRFLGGTDGASPLASVVRDSNGNLYGTTECGGTEPLCYGTVYKVDPDGSETVLYRFQGGVDGEAPAAPLLLDKLQKNLYGTASGGGTHELGVVFRVKLP